MTENIDPRTVATAPIFHELAKRAIEVQSEFSQKLLEASKHCLEQMQRSSTEAWELFWKINSTPSISERLEACQAWMKDVTERSATDASYFLETARSLSEIELKMLKRPSTEFEKAA
ncbi:MAG TPA: hypothetical protein VHB49_17690 [Bradyrhizobium sp.]|nr:hypothetical protein [Bradyrhizobium sp.]